MSGWLRRLFGRTKLDRDLENEIRFHVEAHARDLMAEGVSPDEARRRALAAFGGLEPIKERARDARGTRWIDDAVLDWRHAFRSLRRQKAFAGAALLSLSVGVGANTAVFNVLNALLLRPLPVAAPARLLYVERVRPVAPGRNDEKRRFSYPAFERYAKALASRDTTLAAMSSTTRMQLTLGPAGDADAELVLGQVVSGNWFDVMGVSSAAGRLLTADDDLAGGGRAVAVISHGFWIQHFAGDRSAIGSTIRLNGTAVTIIGVTAPRFEGFIVGEPVDVWVPIGMQQAVRYASNADVDGQADMSKPWRTQEYISWLTLVARVRPPAPIAGANAVVAATFQRELKASAADIQDPEQRAFALRESARLAPGARGISDIRDQFGAAVEVLMATVALVLLVACANLAHLLMARNAARAREFAVRLSLGAGRGRLVRQLLTETMMLAMLGGAASLLVAVAGSRALLVLASAGPTPLPLDVSLQPQIVGFAALVAVLTGLLVGLLPAIRFSRPNVSDAMKSGGRVIDRGLGSRLPLGRMLLVAQVALSLVLVVGATLFVRTLHNLLTTDPGFRAAHVVLARFDPRMAGYSAATLPALRVRLLDAARAIPGAQAAAVAMCGSLANCQSVNNIDVPGRKQGVGTDTDVQEDYVDAAYFNTLGMTFVAGRDFLPSDTETAQPVAIVNEAMVRHFFGDVNVVGREFYQGKTYRIIGVVHDSHINGLRADPPRMAFYPYSQHPDVPMRNLYVRAEGDAPVVAQQLRAVLRSVDRGIAVREMVTLSDLADRSVARERLVSSLTGIFGGLAIAVACLGLYGSVSYSVARRTNEIGVRLALGATPVHVRWLVLRETLGLVGAGCAVGLLLAIPSLEVIAGLLYGLTPRDPATLAGAAAGVIVIGVMVASLPAWRASRLDPLVALRLE